MYIFVQILIYDFDLKCIGIVQFTVHRYSLIYSGQVLFNLKCTGS